MLYYGWMREMYLITNQTYDYVKGRVSSMIMLIKLYENKSVVFYDNYENNSVVLWV